MINKKGRTSYKLRDFALSTAIMLILIEESISWCLDRKLSVGGPSDVRSIDFHPLGGFFATADASGKVSKWDMSSWAIVANYTWNSKFP
jgi:hypothetical protein